MELPEGHEIVPATWKGLRRVAEVELPEGAWAKLAPHWETILETPKEAWENDANMIALKESLGPAGWMTPENYAAVDDTPAAARLLLEHRFNALIKYYTGDGFTEHGSTWTRTSYREFFVPNMPLTSIPADQQVALTVLPK